MKRVRWVAATAAVVLGWSLGCSSLPPELAETVKGGVEDVVRGSNPEAPAAEPRKSRGSTDGGTKKVTFQYEGRERFAYVHVPRDYDPETPIPVLFAFHGGTGRASGAKAFSRVWRPLFDDGMILVFPNGQAEDASDTSWEAHSFDNTQDVALVKEMLRQVSSRYNVDDDKVYAAGFSNGGLMTTMLACHMPEAFAGFAVFSQTVHKHIAAQCNPSVKRPVLYLAGTADSHWDGRHFSLSAMESVAWWAKTLGCTGQPRKEDLPEGPEDGMHVQRWTFEPCSDVSGFEFLKVENGEHIWPGKDLPDAGRARCTDIDGAYEVKDFFRRRAGL